MVFKVTKIKLMKMNCVPGRNSYKLKDLKASAGRAHSGYDFGDDVLRSRASPLNIKKSLH